MSIQNNPDLVDTFDLFKTFFAKKLKQEVSVKFKGDGNQIQFNFNADIIADLVKCNNAFLMRIVLVVSLFQELFLSLRNAITSYALQTNLQQDGKQCASTRATILLLILRMKNVFVPLKPELFVPSIKIKKRPHPYKSASTTAPSATVTAPNRQPSSSNQL